MFATSSFTKRKIESIGQNWTLLLLNISEFFPISWKILRTVEMHSVTISIEEDFIEIWNEKQIFRFRVDGLIILNFSKTLLAIWIYIAPTIFST